MATLDHQVSSLAQRLAFASDDDAASVELAVEAAVLAAASDALRTRPANLPDYVRVQTPEQVASVRASTLRDWLALRDEAVAASLSTAEVAARLGMSSAAVTKRRQARRLVAFQVKGDWRYPGWQLVGGGVLPGVDRVWQALPLTVHDAIGLARWFELSSSHLGATPLSLLQAGEVERVLDAAAYVGGS